MIVLPEEIRIVLDLLNEEENCFLIGGAVRDLLIKRTIQDFDFICDFDPRVLGRKVANQLGGAFYVMDDKRLTSRVINPSKGGSPTSYDFALIQGNLEEDLKSRDFTINAMAVDLRNQNSIIDPLKGGRDLQEKNLRLCSNSSLINDPVRVIRAVRYAVDFKLKIDHSTREQISLGVPLMGRVSTERKRDEFFKILENSKTTTAIRLSEELGILKELEIFYTSKALDQLRIFELFTSILLNREQKLQTEFFVAAAFLSAFSIFRDQMRPFLTERNSNGHTRIQLDKFTSLFWIENSNNVKESILLQAFSNVEVDQVKTLIRSREIILSLLNTEPEITGRVAYQFFKQLGEKGIDLILLGLASIASVPAAELDQREWLKILDQAIRLLDFWFNHPNISRPRPLINGSDLMKTFNLEESPLIGQLLEEMKDEQSAGVIIKKEEALNWVKNRLAQIKAQKDT